MQGNTPAANAASLPIVDLRPIDVNVEGLQSRYEMNPETIGDYTDLYRDGVALPPLDVFYDGSTYSLADGHHRHVAAVHAEIEAIPCVIHPGGFDDALRFSLGSNKTHGLRRSIADRHHAIRVALNRWPEMSDRGIAELVGVDRSTVASLRGQVAKSATCEVRQGRDGKKYRRKAKPAKYGTLAPELADSEDFWCLFATAATNQPLAADELVMFSADTSPELFSPSAKKHLAENPVVLIVGDVRGGVCLLGDPRLLEQLREAAAWQ